MYHGMLASQDRSQNMGISKQQEISMMKQHWTYENENSISWPLNLTSIIGWSHSSLCDIKNNHDTAVYYAQRTYRRKFKVLNWMLTNTVREVSYYNSGMWMLSKLVIICLKHLLVWRELHQTVLQLDMWGDKKYQGGSLLTDYFFAPGW